ncbi:MULTISPECIES: hydroxyethylthiazole kinase [unclassified Caballeronia]|uniref:hydroxyethylthiazole kinase n=1 Tax=unclassified Caballeronia TaxID=2646786 RepID=UPI002860DC07|nr:MULTISPECIES: hydroxyethylthiazole kinase [unclassified Caballeronia]MDR5750429.1 hydroxyethylthiazole kinase [Caballeronia sp. LZ024]MDR5842538.1 hydroxyethylthiazole kinase [Caballeronia sp. LZ031]
MHADLHSFATRVREHVPLVHCLTNLVVTNFTANVLLAIGAAPAMVVAREEAGEFAAIAHALSVNLGTLDVPQSKAIRIAVDAANAAGKPWVLDPVAVGPLAFRTEFALDLLESKPAVIRGNASEIISLAGGTASGRGVDSTAATDAALDAAQILALKTQATVAVTGATDYITDGRRTIALSNGSPLMTRVTGVGCALSATVAAFVGAADGSGEHWLATVAAVAYSTIAGELAARDAALPGSFAVAYLDRLASLDAGAFAATLVARDIAAV